jgi:hypothetical protein
MMQNKKYPLILGSITRNVVISMTEVSMFNMFLDEKDIKKNMGTVGELAMKAVLQISQGVKNIFSSKLSNLNE